MPGKSRQRGGKSSPQSKKKKGRSSHAAIPARQPAAAQAHEPVVPPGVSVAAPSVPTPKTKPVTVQYPYITTELRTIGILGGIMLIGLIVLALVLS